MTDTAKKGKYWETVTDLNSGLSLLRSVVMASTSGPLSTTNLTSFSAICWVSASAGGETLSSLSVLGLNSHSYYCTVLKWPSYTTSLEPIEDKKRKEEQGGIEVVNRGLYGCEVFIVTMKNMQN